MAIKYAILGFLSAGPATGYDLKKQFAESDLLYWSGNNNQIYRALLDLHAADLVAQDVELQPDSPPRKVYTITAAGRAALADWVRTPPDLPQIRHPLLIQLIWADQSDPAGLDALLAAYEEELRVKLLMLREQVARGTLIPGLGGAKDGGAKDGGAETGGAETDASLRQALAARWLALTEHELDWVRDLRATHGLTGRR